MILDIEAVVMLLLVLVVVTVIMVVPDLVGGVEIRDVVPDHDKDVPTVVAPIFHNNVDRSTDQWDQLELNHLPHVGSASLLPYAMLLVAMVVVARMWCP